MTDHMGILSFIILAIDLWAIISVITSRRGIGAKVLWTLCIMCLPIVGALLWLLMGPRASSS